jgi:hypothetical protein
MVDMGNDAEIAQEVCRSLSGAGTRCSHYAIVASLGAGRTCGTFPVLLEPDTSTNTPYGRQIHRQKTDSNQINNHPHRLSLVSRSERQWAAR